MISELIHLGELSKTNGYADISVGIMLRNEKIAIPNLKAFIDTGATNSAINISVLTNHLDLNIYQKIQSGGANGMHECFRIPQIGIVLLPFGNMRGIPLDFIDTVNMVNGYDVIIGNDILHMCEFMYNGLSKTYLLKLFQAK